MTPEKRLYLDSNWEHFDSGVIRAEPQTRVIMFKSPPGQHKFGSVRVVQDGLERVLGGTLWDVFSSEEFPAYGLYTGIVPMGLSCHLRDVEVKLFWEVG